MIKMVNKVFIPEEIENSLKSKIIKNIQVNDNLNVIISFEDNSILDFSYSYDDGDLFAWEIDFDNSNCFSEGEMVFIKSNFQATPNVPYWKSFNNDLWTESDFVVGKSLYDSLEEKVIFVKIDGSYSSTKRGVSELKLSKSQSPNINLKTTPTASSKLPTATSLNNNINSNNNRCLTR